MSNKKLSNLIKIAILSTMAFVLMYFSFPLPIFPNFLRLDISDVPALLGAFSMGPIAGVVIELIKNILEMLIKGSYSAGVGEFANFTIGSALVLTAAGLYKGEKSRKSAVLGLVAGTLVMSVVASVENYYILLPVYEKVGMPITEIVKIAATVNSLVKDKYTLITYSILPFNLLKGFLASFITFLVYKTVSPILHK